MALTLHWSHDDTFRSLCVAMPEDDSNECLASAKAAWLPQVRYAIIIAVMNDITYYHMAIVGGADGIIV